jgi:hypothetical protein
MCDVVKLWVSRWADFLLENIMPNFQVDYLVGCYEGEGQGLFLAAGSSQGSVALFELSLAEDMSACTVNKPAAQLCGGHSDVVCFDAHNFSCFPPFC